jgi:hypothetical protein
VSFLLATVLALSPSSSVLTYERAQAAVACSGLTFLFSGTDPPGNHNYGVRGSLERRIPALCGANHSDSSLWVMTTGGCAEEYIQSGYGRHQGQAFNVFPFAQYDVGVGSAFVHKELADPVPAGSKIYSTRYNFSSGAISAFYDGIKLLSVNIDTAWCVGRGSQHEGEVHDKGDDIPGTAANKASLQSMEKINVRGGAWVALEGLTASSDSNRYGVDWVDNKHMRVWTK